MIRSYSPEQTEQGAEFRHKHELQHREDCGDYPLAFVPYNFSREPSLLRDSPELDGQWEATASIAPATEEQYSSDDGRVLHDEQFQQKQEKIQFEDCGDSPLLPFNFSREPSLKCNKTPIFIDYSFFETSETPAVYIPPATASEVATEVATAATSEVASEAASEVGSEAAESDYREEAPNTNITDAVNEFPVVESSQNYVLQKELELLFDMETVRVDAAATTAAEIGSGSSVLFNLSPIRRRLVRIDHTTLQRGGVTIESEVYVRYEETGEAKTMNPQLHVNFIKDCAAVDQQRGNIPAMPSLRLHMRDRDYHEPMRDRDKNWFLDSQREVIHHKGIELVEPQLQGGVKLGQYKDQHSRHLSSHYWLSQFQNLVRDQRLLQQAAIISDTNCVVTVYGIGVNGRIISDGSASGRMLAVEVLSLWDCQRHQVMLSILQLRKLFGARPEFLKAGRKIDLVRALLRLLYFKYSLHIRSMTGRSEDDYYATAEHLEALTNLPKGYPRTIEQMIRVPPVPPDDPAFPLPTISQQLCIGTDHRENGPELRKRLAQQRRIEEARLEEERIRALLALPKRKRERVGIRVVRGWNYFVIVSAYHEHLRPDIISLRAVVSKEAASIRMFVPIGRVRKSYELQQKSKADPGATVEQCVPAAIATLAFHRSSFESSSSAYYLYMSESHGLHSFLRVQTDLEDVLLRNARRRSAAAKRAVFADPLQLRVPLESRFVHLIHAADFTAVPQQAKLEKAAIATVAATKVVAEQVMLSELVCVEEREAAAALDATEADAAHRCYQQHGVATAFTSATTGTASTAGRRLLSSWNSLGAAVGLGDSYSRRTATAVDVAAAAVAPWRPALPPRRLLRRGKLLTSRAARIGAVRCIYAISAVGMGAEVGSCFGGQYRGDVPLWPRFATTEEIERGADIVMEEMLPLFVEKMFSELAAIEVKDEVDFVKSGKKKRRATIRQEEEDAAAAAAADGEDDDDATADDEDEKEDEIPNFDDNGNESDEEEDDDSSDDDDERGLKSLVEIDVIDTKNAAYAKFADEQLFIELEVYVPLETALPNSVTVPASSTFRRYFSKDDLDKVLHSAEERELLPVALQALYVRFASTAARSQVAKAEEAWDRIGLSLMRSCKWSSRRWLPQSRWRAAKELMRKGKLDELHDKFSTAERLTIAQSLLHQEARLIPTAQLRKDESWEIDWDKGIRALDARGIATTVEHTTNTTTAAATTTTVAAAEGGLTAAMAALAEPDYLNFGKSKQQNLNDRASSSEAEVPYYDGVRMMLSWSNIILSRSIKIRSIAPQRGEFITLRVDVWQRESELGAVCYDRRNNSNNISSSSNNNNNSNSSNNNSNINVYFVQSLDRRLQATQIRNSRFLSEDERATSLVLFFTAALVYSETADGSGRVSFDDGAKEEAAIDLDAVVEADYGDAAEDAITAAAAKVQQRAKKRHTSRRK